MTKSKDDVIIEKSLWSKKKYWKFYCPHCKGERRISNRPNPFQFGYLFKVFITTVFFMMLTWSVFGWHGFVIFFPLWIVFEIYFRIKTRASLICERCGFDPVLFLRDVKLAKKEVEKFWVGKLPSKVAPEQADTKQQDEKGAQSQNGDIVKT